MRRLHARSCSDLVFGLISGLLLFGVCTTWALITPIGSAPDEPTHVIRAASVVRGDLGGAMTETPSPGPGQSNWATYRVVVPASYAALDAQPGCYMFQPSVSAACSTPIPDDGSPEPTSTYAGSYPPSTYVIIGLPSLFLPAHRGVYAMRLALAAHSAALFALGLVAARRIGGAALVAGSALAVTPMAVHLSSSVNPSGIEVAAAFTAWLTAIDLLVDRSTAGSRPRSLLPFCVASCVLVANRSSGALVLAVIAMCCITTFGTRRRLHSLIGERSVRIGGAALATTVVAAGLWIVYARSLSLLIGTPRPEASNIEIAQHATSQQPWYAQQMVGVFGWLDTRLPDSVWWLWVTIAFAFVVIGFIVGPGSARWGLVVTGLLAVIAPPLSQISSVRHFGYVWSGRYQLPFAMGLLLIAATVTSIGIRRLPSWADTAVTLARAVIAVLIGIGFCSGAVVLLQRFGTGVASGRFDYLRQAEWQPPLGAIASTALAGIAALAWAAWVFVSPGRSSKTADVQG